MLAIQADFVLAHGAQELGALEAALAIQSSIPRANVDWSKGRARAQKRLDQLIAMGCPEIIYRGQQRLVDKMFYVQIPANDSQAFVCGYCFGFSHYDGCISLESSPYDVDCLKRVAREFAAVSDDGGESGAARAVGGRADRSGAAAREATGAGIVCFFEVFQG